MKRYTTQHEWVELVDGVATVGISAYAAEELGDITFVELPETGVAVRQGDVLTAIESVKAASDIYAPVSGTVSVVNSALEEQPEIVNESPEQAGWICRLTAIDENDLAVLMDEDAYDEFVRQ